jgi:ATP:corrinoid adenosyltransferase
MIFPTEFPIKENYSKAEEKIFNALSKLDDSDYTIFYSQEFSSINPRESNEYEIDFIIADHRDNKLNSIIVVEAKGGNIRYDGKNNVWYQNNRELNKGPNIQATSAMHNLINRFGFIARNVPFHWLLWFPDVEISETEWLPTNLSKDRLLDAKALSFTSDYIDSISDGVIENQQNRSGAPMSDFVKFKNTLLRSVGFFKPLHKEFTENENTFKRLTEQQENLYKRIDMNPNICVQGPAGSGKTVIAFNKTLLFAEQGLKVMYVCFNKTLATELRHRSKNQIVNRELAPEFTNFHFWAKRIAESNPTFNNERDSDEFFNTYIPNKAKEMIEEPIYDVIIVDEGQDFRENWLELLNKVLKKEGRFLLFMDENQDIFNAYKGVPNHRNITRYALDENCRNTKTIITKLKAILPTVKMNPMEFTPEGSPIKYFHVSSKEEQVKQLEQQIILLLNEQIKPNQIIILTNNLGGESSLKGVKTLGNRRLISTYDREFGKDENCIAQTTINVFKGMEADVIFILDAQNIETDNQLYTQASRAKQMLYMFFLKNNSNE